MGIVKSLLSPFIMHTFMIRFPVHAFMAFLMFSSLSGEYLPPALITKMLLEPFAVFNARCFLLLMIYFFNSSGVASFIYSVD